MTLTYDLTGNSIKADSVTADVTGNITGNINFPTASAETVGTNLTGFDKAIKIAVNGVDYWVGAYNDND